MIRSIEQPIDEFGERTQKRLGYHDRVGEYKKKICSQKTINHQIKSNNKSKKFQNICTFENQNEHLVLYGANLREQNSQSEPDPSLEQHQPHKSPTFLKSPTIHPQHLQKQQHFNHLDTLTTHPNNSIASLQQSRATSKNTIIPLQAHQRDKLTRQFLLRCSQCNSGSLIENNNKDYYNLEHQCIIYYVIHQTHPKYILQSINQQLSLTLQRRVRLHAKLVYVIKCAHNNYYLLSKKTGKVYPKLSKICDIIWQLHKSDHAPLITLKKRTKQLYRYDNKYLDRFIHSVLVNCKCGKFSEFSKVSGHGIYSQNINRIIEQAVRFEMYLHKTPISHQNKIDQIEQTLTVDHKRRFSMQQCSYDCSSDNYPPGFSQVTIKNKQYKIFQCKKGTNHIWKLVSVSQSINSQAHPSQYTCQNGLYYRLPMQQQYQLIANQIHIKNGIHLSITKMLTEMSAQLFLLDAIKQYLENMFTCQTCSLEGEHHQSISELDPFHDSYSASKQRDQRISQNFFTNSELKSSNICQEEPHQIFQEQQYFHKDEIQTCEYMMESIPHLKIYFFPKKQQCTAILIITSKMLENYVRFGDNLVVTCFPSILNQNPYVFTLNGTDNHCRNRIFGIFVLGNLFANDIEYVFHNFYQILGNNPKVYPCSLITPYCEEISEAVKNLSAYFKEKVHFYDMTSVITHFTYGLPNCLAQKVSKKLQSIMTTQNHLQLEFHLKQLKILLPLERYNEFNSNKHKCCVGLLQPAYIGRWFTEGEVEQFSNNILGCLGCYNNWGTFLQRLATLDKSIVLMQNNSRIRSELQRYNKQPQIKLDEKIRKSLSLIISNEILQSIDRIQTLQNIMIRKQSKSGNEIIIQDQLGQHVVKYRLPDNMWVCSCRKLVLMGYPCVHLMMAVMKSGGNILYYINPRWLIKPIEQILIEV